MIMTPISLPPCQGPPSNTTEADSLEKYRAKKRASIHFAEDSTSAKRMSLYFGGPRCRSFSESWVLLSAATCLPEAGKDSSEADSALSNARWSGALSPLSSAEENASVSSGSFASFASSTCPSSSSFLFSSQTSPSSLASVAGINTTRNTTDLDDDMPDKELLKTLASFLRGESGQGQVDKASAKGSDPDTTSSVMTLAGPNVLNVDGLVVQVRDFAYPSAHPYHFGNYPPEPDYEESDIEEDEEEEEEAEEETQGSEGRTHGLARGLYDFEAEDVSELSFKEGDELYVHGRQYPGWFLGELAGATGLVPENYVQIL